MVAVRGSRFHASTNMSVVNVNGTIRDQSVLLSLVQLQHQLPNLRVNRMRLLLLV